MSVEWVPKRIRKRYVRPSELETAIKEREEALERCIVAEVNLRRMMPDNTSVLVSAKDLHSVTQRAETAEANLDRILSVIEIEPDWRLRTDIALQQKLQTIKEIANDKSS